MVTLQKELLDVLKKFDRIPEIKTLRQNLIDLAKQNLGPVATRSLELLQAQMVGVMTRIKDMDANDFRVNIMINTDMFKQEMQKVKDLVAEMNNSAALLKQMFDKNTAEINAATTVKAKAALKVKQDALRKLWNDEVQIAKNMTEGQPILPALQVANQQRAAVLQNILNVKPAAAKNAPAPTPTTDGGLDTGNIFKAIMNLIVMIFSSFIKKYLPGNVAIKADELVQAVQANMTSAPAAPTKATPTPATKAAPGAATPYTASYSAHVAANKAARAKVKPTPMPRRRQVFKSK